MPLQQFDERDPFAQVFVFDDSTVPGTYVIIWSDLGRDVRLDTIMVVNWDTVDHNFPVAFNGTNDEHMMVSVAVPAGAGTGIVPAVDLLAVARDASNHFLIIGSFDTWAATVRETISAGKGVNLVMYGGSF